ncbi:MAG: GC-type dockerin domain-anchored protein [Planctomycetota bacterium]
MRITAALVALAGLASAGAAAPKIIDSVIGADVTFGDTPTSVSVTFAASETATGVAVDGQWEFVSGDSGGGVFPWSLDMTIDVTAPDAQTFTWGPTIGGDVTIADYPIADTSQAGLAGAPGAGMYTLEFRNQPAAGGVSRLAGPTFHLATEVADVTFDYSGSPDPMSSWDRPFFIEGVSGLGPVAFDVFEFSVDVSGGYTLESTLDVVDDHFTFLYRGAFDPAQPLVNLLDYGLGNGSSPFGVPRGTSRIEALLFEGETYFWVTSQWASFKPLIPFSNSITGPGPLSGVGPVCSPADITADSTCDFGTSDGLITLSDFACYLALWSVGDPNADVTATSQCVFGSGGDGVDLSDFSCYLSEWSLGCP